ncbi:MAG TPA: hypothetical protein GX017_06215 [Clostridiales bacterium]|nr:hypothetical protein [Clostridiales bacterium]
MKKASLFILLLSLCLFQPLSMAGASAGSDSLPPASSESPPSLPEADSPDGEYRYRTREGLMIVSYVDAWQGDKLAEAAEELKRNKHGLEMEYLDRVEIHPGSEPNGNQQVSASYERELQQVGIPIHLSGFLPEDYQLKVNLEKGVIRIYKGEEKQAAEDIATDLAHEYGHHFTFFHFDDAFSPKEFKESTYYQVRRLQQYPKVNGRSDYEEEIHRWSIFEIAAEDYHQLLGSPASKRITHYFDISEKMGSTTYQPVNTASRYDFNAIPQENWDIPLAFQVEGLHPYFLSFLEEPIGVAALAPFPRQKTAELTARLPILSHRVEEHFTFKKHIVEWDPIEEGYAEQPVYTLVAINRENRVIPIKTVYPGEKTAAVVGTVTQAMDSYIYYYQDGLDQGSLDFRLYLQYPDGRVLASEDLTVDFDTDD